MKPSIPEGFFVVLVQVCSGVVAELLPKRVFFGTKREGFRNKGARKWY